MDQAQFDRYLTERYADQIQWYERNAARNKRRYLWFQWSAIIFSSSLPVLVVALPERLEWLTATLSVLLAITTASLKTFKFQENWIGYRTTAETLKKEKYFYDAEIGDYAERERKKQIFIDRVEGLISRENTLWLTTQMRKEEKKKGP